MSYNTTRVVLVGMLLTFGALLIIFADLENSAGKPCVVEVVK